VESAQALEVVVAPIHHVEGARLGVELIENVDGVELIENVVSGYLNPRLFAAESGKALATGSCS
jgi:hypothetical protein